MSIYTTPTRSVAAGRVVRSADGEVYYYSADIARWVSGYGPYATTTTLGAWVEFSPSGQDFREGLPRTEDSD